MAGDLRQVRLGALTLNVQSRTESLRRCFRQLRNQSVKVEVSIDYIDNGIRDYEMLDANCTRPTTYALRATLRFCMTVAVGCRTTSNGRRIFQAPDFHQLSFDHDWRQSYLRVGMLRHRLHERYGQAKAPVPSFTPVILKMHTSRYVTNSFMAESSHVQVARSGAHTRAFVESRLPGNAALRSSER